MAASWLVATAGADRWDKIRANVFDIGTQLKAMIESHEWKLLGYSDLYEAWGKEMAEVELASAFLPMVAYAMFAEGTTPEQVAVAVKGVGPTIAKSLKAQRDAGVDAEQATTRNKPRSKQPRMKTLFLQVTSETMLLWRSVAQNQGRSVEEIALAAIEVEFERLARKRVA